MRLTSLLSIEIDRLGTLRSRPVLATSTWLVDSRAEELGRYIARSRELVDRVVERSLSQLGELTGHLRALSPQRTLDRGYAIAQLSTGTALRSAADAPGGTRLLLTLAKGTLHSVVEPTPGGEKVES